MSRNEPDFEAVMTNSFSIDPKTSALLVMDFQALILDSYAKDKDALLRRTANVLESARKAGMTIVYVVVGFRSGYPEISARNASFNGVKASGIFAAGDAKAEIHPAVAPRPGEPIVTKHRVGAFFGTDMDMILRSNNIETLVLTGITTSGVVLSTVRHASDADYRLVVVRDCCTDGDDEVHRVLVEKVFLRQTNVVTASDVVTALR
jgi:nicotinamidase-related amidase